jgi:hypothetical protein
MGDQTKPKQGDGSSFFHQSWAIVGGTLMVQIRTERVLLGDEYVEIGKVMGELERLAELLGAPDPTDEQPTKEQP